MILLASLLFRPDIWLVVGIALIIADMFAGTYWILPVGAAALLMATGLWLDSFLWPAPIVLTTPARVLLVFALLSLAAMVVLRKVFQTFKQTESDINDY